MRTHTKLLLTGLAAGVILAAMLSGASANRLRLSNRSFRATWTALRLISIAGTVECPITMEGSFHSSTISKIIGALVGYVTKATALTSACAGGTESVEGSSLPWHIRYRGFSGSLPNITGIGIGIIGTKFRTSIEFVTCTFSTSAANPFVAIWNRTIAGGGVNTLSADSSAEIPLRGSFLCEIGGNGQFSGTGEVFLLGANTRITVTLI